MTGDDHAHLVEAIADINQVLGNTQIRADQIALTAARDRLVTVLERAEADHAAALQRIDPLAY